jgi:peptidoglycan/xylan/chitin deacetylase (PgdA/CDA1 family)
MTKPICSLSLDLDNQWSYMKTHGDPAWQSLPSYLDLVVPRALEVLRHFDWTITFFIVGQDAALAKNRGALATITGAGHEVGNHSFRHEPWLHLYSENETDAEITRAEEAIEGATGQRPRGFRGPGYSLSATTLNTLAHHGYRYDASTLPTYLGPLARAYYFLRSELSSEEKQQRKILFGVLRDGLRPVRPYLWDLPKGELLEIPVTTAPIVKLPFHFSYLLYISVYSKWLSMHYLRAALRLCRLTRTEPSLLLHPLDFLGADDVSELAFFPAMQLSGTRKVAYLMEYLRILESHYTVVPLSDHASRHLERRTIPLRSPAELLRPA